jgi:hypothetical protein
MINPLLVYKLSLAGDRLYRHNNLFGEKPLIYGIRSFSISYFKKNALN